MSNMEKVVKQAIATFAKPQSAAKYQESLNVLAQAVAELTGDDVGVNKELVKRHNRKGLDPANPVGYVSVFEDTNVLVSIFVLKSNSVIPLHDHPLMHGILKVLHGSVRIQSYSLRRCDNDRVVGLDSAGNDDVEPCSSMNDYYRLRGGQRLYNGDAISVRRNPAVTLSAAPSANGKSYAVLTPFEANIHEVASVNGPSAFLDVLAPPYDTAMGGGVLRDCSYFDVLEGLVGSDDECILTPSKYDSNYWTVSLPYVGPKIKV